MGFIPVDEWFLNELVGICQQIVVILENSGQSFVPICISGY
jgi:hypothetical protein